MSEKDLLKRIHLFSSLDESEAGTVLSFMRRRKVVRGEVVFRQHDAESALYLILEGEVKISRLGRDGREVILALLRQGTFFGEMSLLDGQPRSATATTTRAGHLLVLDRNNFLRSILPMTGIMTKILQELSKRLRAADQNIENLALGTVFDRLFHFLGHLGRRFPMIEGKTVITKHPTHQELAELIGSSRETVTRALASMEKLGLIELQKREILLLPAFFQEEADRSC